MSHPQKDKKKRGGKKPTAKNAPRLANENAKLARATRTKVPLEGQSQRMGSSQVSKRRLKSSFHPDIDAYFRTLADPWKNTGVRCPVNYNPVPSFVTQFARTTCTRTQVSVAFGTSSNINLFPGHSMMYSGTAAGSNSIADSIPITDFDEVAYHSPVQNIGGGAYIAGPMNAVVDSGTSTVTGVAGFITSGLTPGYVSNTSAASTALEWDQVLPYISNPSSGHSRWKLVSMGIRIENVTPELARGGSIQSYQPVNNVNQITGPIQSYAQIPTYKDWGTAGCEITWIPRMRDVAYWHLTGALISGGTLSPRYIGVIPGISISLSAPSGAPNSQSYDFQIVCNWELAGNLFAPIGTPGPHMPETKSVVERVHSELINTAPSAAEAVAVGRKMFTAVKAGLGMFATAATAAA